MGGRRQDRNSFELCSTRSTTILSVFHDWWSVLVALSVDQIKVVSFTYMAVQEHNFVRAMTLRHLRTTTTEEEAC
jgi:hypothetical protein